MKWAEVRSHITDNIVTPIVELEVLEVVVRKIMVVKESAYRLWW